MLHIVHITQTHYISACQLVTVLEDRLGKHNTVNKSHVLNSMNTPLWINDSVSLQYPQQGGFWQANIESLPS